MAAQTKRTRIGCSVTGNVYRHPAGLAKARQDHIRVILVPSGLRRATTRRAADHAKCARAAESPQICSLNLPTPRGSAESIGVTGGMPTP
jgi:hypothetical protein